MNHLWVFVGSRFFQMKMLARSFRFQNRASEFWELSWKLVISEHWCAHQIDWRSFLKNRLPTSCLFVRVDHFEVFGISVWFATSEWNWIHDELFMLICYFDVILFIFPRTVRLKGVSRQNFKIDRQGEIFGPSGRDIGPSDFFLYRQIFFSCSVIFLDAQQADFFSRPIFPCPSDFFPGPSHLSTDRHFSKSYRPTPEKLPSLC